MKALRRLRLEERLHRATRSLPPVARERLDERVVKAKLRLGHRLVPEAALEAFFSKVLSSFDEPPAGAYLEFGVYVGSSMACMHRALENAGNHDVRCIGFDSFQGLPESAATEDLGLFQPGSCHSTEKLARWYLDRAGVDWTRTDLVSGWYQDTLTPATARRIAIQEASIVMVDCVLASSTRAALAFCAPFIRERTVVIFDDWHAHDLAMHQGGERRAFEEFLREERRLRVEPFGSTYQPEAEVFVLRSVGSSGRGRPKASVND